MRNQERKKERRDEARAQALIRDIGSDLVDRRAGRSIVGSGDSMAAFNALILSAINALCLLLGVTGRTDKDCDLVGAVGTISNGSAVSSFDCDIDWKMSNADDVRG